MYNPSSNSAMNDKRRAYTGASGGLPPMMPSHFDNLNNSVLSAGANGPTGSSPKNQNYRKAFKPSLGAQGQSTASYEPERRLPNQVRRNVSNSNQAYDSSKYEEPSPPRQQLRGRPSPMQS
jgi:hypothetical protein